MDVRTYVEPARRWGWEAVAEEPIENSKWWLPPRHKAWRPTRRMAHRAVARAIARLERDVARRERDNVAARARHDRRELA